MSTQDRQAVPNRPFFPQFPPELVLSLYRTMLRIRRLQEALIREYHPADEMRCPVHFCLGQEALAAGTVASLVPDDYLFSHHRSHGYFIAKGGAPRELVAELYGKVTGANGGMSGSQELSSEKINFFSGTILSGGAAMAAGVALAAQIRGEKRITMTVFGDGGADEGIIYETLNFAALKRLPMVFICENNQFSTYSSQSSRQPACNLAEKAHAFGVPSRKMFGNDVLAVYAAARQAVESARGGAGPFFLELETGRWCSHVGPGSDEHLDYRSPENVIAWRERCPIALLSKQLLESKLASPADLERLEQEVASEVAGALQFAKTSPFPAPETMFKVVFAEQKVRAGEASETGAHFDFTQKELVPGPY